jgi:hypothetical protein
MAETYFRLYTGFMGEAGYRWEAWTDYSTYERAIEGMIDFLKGVDSHPELTPIKILECVEADRNREDAGVLVYEQGLSVEEWGRRCDSGEILI